MLPKLAALFIAIFALLAPFEASSQTKLSEAEEEAQAKAYYSFVADASTRITSLMQEFYDQGAITTGKDFYPEAFVKSVYAGFWYNEKSDENLGKRTGYLLASLELLNLKALKVSNGLSPLDFFTRIFSILNRAPATALKTVTVKSFGGLDLRALLTRSKEITFNRADGKFDVTFETDCNGICKVNSSELNIPYSFFRVDSLELESVVKFEFCYLPQEIAQNLLVNFSNAKTVQKDMDIRKVISNLKLLLDSQNEKASAFDFNRIIKPGFSVQISGINLKTKLGFLPAGDVQPKSIVISQTPNSATWLLGTFNAHIKGLFSGLGVYAE